MILYGADFETTTPNYPSELQSAKERLEWVKSTGFVAEVWSAAICKVGTEDINIYSNLDDFMMSLLKITENSIIYFHNLKFDGQFILYWLLQQGFKQVQKEFMKKLKPMTFNLLITGMGQWYSIEFITYSGATIKIWDSLKLCNTTLKTMGELYQTKHRKLEMDFENKSTGYTPTPEELEYIKNDVFVLCEAIEKMVVEMGMKKMTLSSNCLLELKQHIYEQHKDAYIKQTGVTEPTVNDIYRYYLPDLSKLSLDYDTYDALDADDYIRRGYRGGWCYVNPRYQNQVIKWGLHYDYNSMYPSQMRLKKMPVGVPTFFQGMPDKAIISRDDIVYFVRFRCCFEIKPNHFPMVQYKGNFRFNTNEWLENSKGQVLEFTLFCEEFKLFMETYSVSQFEFLDGCYFLAYRGLFDSYIDNYIKIKASSKGAKRQNAKDHLTTPYGKLGSSRYASYKEAYIEGDRVKFKLVRTQGEGEEEELLTKSVENVACAAAITAYARVEIVRDANKNYDNFCYADTDSLAIKGFDIKLANIDINSSGNLGLYKLEHRYRFAKFIRQKTYCEEIIAIDKETTEVKYLWELKAAGMNEAAKQQILGSTNDIISYFGKGLKVDGKLQPVVIPGGVILIPTTFTIK